jgi:hypothetical protein
MSEKVYVVTRGDYSDYHIITATTDKKTADKVAKKFNAEVEIYDNSEIYTKTIFSVTFNEIGDVKYCHELSEYDYPPNNKVIQHKRNNMNYLYIEVEADDEQSAIKIAAEKRAKFLAEQERIV